MKATEAIAPKRLFLDIPNAAALAGFSVRHFRRIIANRKIRVVHIGRKLFIMGADFERWESGRKEQLALRASTKLIETQSFSA